jgi:alcohol dehydrogenase class IV
VAGPGLDTLAHAIEAYTSTWRNDYTDGLSLKAVQLVFHYLVRSYEVGDNEAREKMHYAATIAGLAMSNSQGALAHAFAHPLGAVFHIPHGRAVGLFLPYTIEFTVRAGETRYAEIAHLLGWEATCEEEGARKLVRGIRELARRIEEPLSIQELGIDRQEYEASLLKMIESGENDTVSSQRIPDREEMRNLFLYAYEGKEIDF